MTNFEVERMEAAFEYLENKLNDHYSLSAGMWRPGTCQESAEPDSPPHDRV